MISVIIPVYNTPSAWLLECLKSLVTQTVSDWEAIIVDDASREPVIDQLRRLAIADDRIRIIRHEANRGVAAARNSAIAAARGDYLLTLDADDRLDPGFMNTALAALTSDPSADCAVCDFAVFGETESRWKNEPKGAVDMVLDQWMPGPGVLMRRGLFDRVGGYPEGEVFRLGNEDWDFWIGAVGGGLRVAYIPEALYRYRVSSSSLSNTAMKRGYYKTAEAMYERHRELIDGFGLAKRFLFDGYYFSIRRCPRAELFFVVRKALALASGPRQASRALALLARRVGKAAIVPFARKARS